MTIGRTIDLIGRTFVSKVMSLLFNVLSKLIIAFLPSDSTSQMMWPKEKEFCDNHMEKNIQEHTKRIHIYIYMYLAIYIRIYICVYIYIYH